jgi:DnaK suppressor protein
LDSSAVAAYRSILEQRLREVEEALGLAAEGAAPVALDQARVGRLARIDALQQQALAAGRRDALLTERRRLTAATERIRAGHFGICCRCDSEIDDARLRADPATPFCLACLAELKSSR